MQRNAVISSFNLTMRFGAREMQRGLNPMLKDPTDLCIPRWNRGTGDSGCRGVVAPCDPEWQATSREWGWVEDAPGPATRLEIEVREPVVRHTVTLAQLHRCASGATRSPAERIRRERMRQLLGVHESESRDER